MTIIHEQHTALTIAAENAAMGHTEIAMTRLMDLGWSVGFHAVTNPEYDLRCTMYHPDHNGVLMGNGNSIGEVMANAITEKIG